ncbi:hypothetical protein [Natranaeroarchaeum sulfidigenes]|uniref:Uncharacterized protein n=1 Tax=Natranaeroarchaeum sulfidigenes TaxID=2784880 RepID=A0A897MK85_9EURY|nr:hypothetical protein [Natranaeroarchaeum sulfidigenes]QSG02520.1 hypothetical protein AArcS_1303 [Natranaeroarchaeum sulfidigenes]
MSATDQQELRREEREAQRDDRNISAGMGPQQEMMREMMQNPEVIELLSTADLPTGAQSDKSWLPELTEEHLNMDQVLAIRDDRDLWERKWLNPNVADEILMSYPSWESRTPNERVEKVRQRIRGDEKEPLDPDQKRKIRSMFEQKYDRETRANGGKFMELLLSHVVESKQNSKQSDDSSVFGSLLGRS